MTYEYKRVQGTSAYKYNMRACGWMEKTAEACHMTHCDGYVKKKRKKKKKKKRVVYH
jgi:hypothetical protein